ncbi:MAG: response regulator [Pyrinomonadaceae bacterium]|nr:response regulator [Pyrinomonadaceae bacterium]
MPAIILIADDYDDTRELLRLMLQAAGYTTREARNGRECVTAARQNTPDLILIDLSMPELDGWGVLKELRADERISGLPCIAVTAFASDADRTHALEAGFNAYLAKPFRSKDLLATVELLLANSHKQ